MTALFYVQTDVGWIEETADVSFFGRIFLLLLAFIPPVLMSFLIQAIIPGLHDDIGFTKAMLVLLPGWNLFLWIAKIKLYIFFIPSWILFGVIAIIKVISNEY